MRRHFEAVVQSAPDAVMALGLDASVTAWNRGAELLFGYSADEMIGTHVWAIEGAEPGEIASLIERVAGGETISNREAVRRHKSGVLVDVAVTYAPIRDEHDHVDAISAIARDIGDLKRAEQERARLADQVHQMQKLETVGQLAGGVAHDFNNLLAVIINYAEFAAGQLMDHPARDDILEIAAAAERAAELTQQLLLFSRHEMVCPDVVSINDVVNGMDNLLHRTIGEDIAVQTRLASDLPNVMADRGQLEQVLLNLVINARDAMPGGGKVVIATRAHHVAQGIRATRVAAGSYARISVTDTGDGMSPEVAERAFEPFFTTKPKGVGTGLGLATIYGIVTAAGGSIEINSAPGKGTSITIDLPAANGALPEPVEVPIVTATPTVLVVEDEAAVGRVAVRVLAEAGYRTLSADGPEHAIELASGHAGPIDVVLTDVVMPSMSGPALAERLGRLRPDARIVFMSGHIERSEKLSPGATFVRKPFHASDLITAVAAALANQVSHDR
jgi:two-component system cell cycle sensor histidine kinase/response regulator CckA